MNDDELVNNVNRMFFNTRSAKDVEGDESISNSYSEEKFAPPQDEGLNEPQQMDEEKGPKKI